MKFFAWLIAAALVLGVGSRPRSSCTRNRSRPPSGRPAKVGDAPHAIVTKTHPHDDIVESHGKGMALLFWMFAAASIAGALFVVTRRNLIAAVMGMVGSFIGIAAVYMMLYAQFLAVIQMLVYAGAIMVLFVFVIMILNRPEDEPVAPTGRIGQVIGGVAIVYLVGRLAMILMNVALPNKAIALAAPAPIMLPGWGSADRKRSAGARSRRSATTCSDRACSRSRPSRSCSWSPWSARSRSRGRCTLTTAPTRTRGSIHERPDVRRRLWPLPGARRRVVPDRRRAACSSAATP